MRRVSVQHFNLQYFLLMKPDLVKSTSGSYDLGILELLENDWFYNRTF